LELTKPILLNKNAVGVKLDSEDSTKTVEKYAKLLAIPFARQLIQRALLTLLSAPAARQTII